MRRMLLVLVVLAILITACAPGKKGQKIELTAPFAGGTTGLVADFVDFRREVFDGGQDPFDVVVKLENKGEMSIDPAKVRVTLSGINPAEFSKTDADLTKNPTDELFAVRKDPQGNPLPGGQTTVEFVGLNHRSSIAGARLAFPLRADVCYLYETKAVSKLCVRENILAPEPGGICEVNEDKPVFNSGAPVQVGAVKESGRGKDKISFSFEIRNAGTGDMFERGSACDRRERSKENRVYVIVDTGMPGLQCTGLGTTGKEGFTTLYAGSKVVACTQTVPRGDFEQELSIRVVYDYEEFKQTELVVKSSGEESPATS